MSVESIFRPLYRRPLWRLHRRLVPLKTGSPIVSFVFDDFPRTAYTVAGALLKNWGVRGTYYVAVGLMGISNELGAHFQLEDLHSLLADGHELANHTFSHISCRSVPALVFRRDVKKAEQAISQITGTSVPANFAYPYGDVTLAARKLLAKETMSCRGISGGINGPGLDLNLLRANSLYGDVDRSVQVNKLVCENADRKGWLIFYTHDVRDNPSPYGCTPALLETALSMVVRRGFSILTVAEVISGLWRRCSVA